MDRLNNFISIGHAVQRACEHPLGNVTQEQRDEFLLEIAPRVAASDVRNETIQQLAMRLAGQDIIKLANRR